MNLNLNKKEKELLMYCVLAFATGYLMCMYFPVHGGRVTQASLPMPVLEGMTLPEANKMSRQELIDELMKGNNNNNGKKVNKKVNNNNNKKVNNNNNNNNNNNKGNNVNNTTER
jgi:hypothetical protein